MAPAHRRSTRETYSASSVARIAQVEPLLQGVHPQHDERLNGSKIERRSTSFLAVVRIGRENHEFDRLLKG
jgi:hypothetical protein